MCLEDSRLCPMARWAVATLPTAKETLDYLGGEPKYGGMKATLFDIDEALAA